jgi:hypothetical protein
VTRTALLIGITTLVWSGCGVVGSPIAPENVGVAPIIERQKQREAAAAGLSGQVPSSPAQTMGTEFGAGGAVEPTEEDLPVPPVQSVGTGVGMR